VQTSLMLLCHARSQLVSASRAANSSSTFVNIRKDRLSIVLAGSLLAEQDANPLRPLASLPAHVRILDLKPMICAAGNSALQKVHFKILFLAKLPTLLFRRG
jgi:hypothetical protein